MLKSNINAIKQNIKNHVESGVVEIEIAGLANLQSSTPVDTGALKRSLGTEVKEGNEQYDITYGSSLDYAPYTEFVNSSKGWMRDTLNEFTSEAKDILIRHLKGVK